MTAFEEKFGSNNQRFYEDCDAWIYIGQKEGWKEALKWVRCNVVSEAWDLTDVDDFIEEELEQQHKGGIK